VPLKFKKNFKQRVYALTPLAELSSLQHFPDS